MGRLGIAVGAATACGAILRFSTLGLQEPWLDEAVTAALMELEPGELLGTVAATESTPPLYYLLTRAWVVPFGTDTVALRSLAALVGTLTIPVVYAAGTALAGRRAGLIAAVLTAVSPPLVWYSQEARAYALLVLLSAVTVMFTARWLADGRRRDLGGWAVAAVLAVLTHYFAGFLVAAEAAWLVAASADRRAVALAVAAVGVSCAVALPLAVGQSGQGNLDWIGTSTLADRLADAGELFLVGPTAGRLGYTVALAAALAVAVGVVAARASRTARAGLVMPAVLAAAAVAMPVALALAGGDYVVPRNLLPALPPLILAASAVLAAPPARGIGVAVAVGLAFVWTALVVAVPLDRTLQRAAITAALVPEPLDPERQRVEPRVAYARGEPARADCPRRHAAVGGGAALLAEGPDDPLGPPHVTGGRRGWSAVAPQGSERRRVYAYAVCVRPLD